ncbi:Glucoamylase [Trichinella spiralis]|uniref:Glucoamylase n=1 Tax=Trichinella spiralis TaxID=6334 RepID=A0ABR3KWK8_TRISP
MLRLLLPLNDLVWEISRREAEYISDYWRQSKHHPIIQSVVATGGVYKGQGGNQRELMTHAYWEFLVQGKQLQWN